ncbi:MAG: UDP-N-acetylglucosamine 2-epimerase (non-hydrolyzing) [Candidatus Thermoplasmatota archaeon]|nr:UDP-N-acetylglucosamine 2-epimerase (non-hydrolyzing) [Candidatus Thermoplasmatota archaeon]
MKLVSIVGARPQFIKSAPVTHALRSRKHKEILVHTGQHYDDAMSEAFFRELMIPKPDVNLEVGSASHAMQTARMLEGLERVLERQKPDAVIIYGDTNSTLAGALAAAKMHIPVAHVEAGLRSFNRRMPEEINRVVADHVSSVLFCPSDAAVENLRTEGITNNVHRVGDTMMDTLLAALKRADAQEILSMHGVAPKEYYLSTVHRAENTDDNQRLASIMDALDNAPAPVLLPAHPRTRKIMAERRMESSGSLKMAPPMGHTEFIALLANAKAMLTDSGGVQKEAYMLGTPCVTLRDETEWVETVEAGWNIIVGADKEKILNAMETFKPEGQRPPLYGDGRAGEEIVDILEKWGKG